MLETYAQLKVSPIRAYDEHSRKTFVTNDDRLEGFRIQSLEFRV